MIELSAAEDRSLFHKKTEELMTNTIKLLHYVRWVDMMNGKIGPEERKVHFEEAFEIQTLNSACCFNCNCWIMKLIDLHCTNRFELQLV